MRKWLSYTIIIVSLMTGAHVSANQPIATDSRIRTLVYGPNEVFRIITAFGYQTNIEFPDDEDIVTISVGDPSLFSITPSGNRLFLKPLVDDRDTNVTIVTTERAYQMEFSSMTDELDQLMYVVRFFYPDKEYDRKRAGAPGIANTGHIQLPNVGIDPAKGIVPFDRDLATSPQALPAAPLPAPEAVYGAPPLPSKYVNSAEGAIAPLSDDTMLNEGGTLNYNYTLSGNSSFAPTRIYDDGLFTYLKFPEGISTMPAVYRVDLQRGIDIPVPAEVQGNRVRINNIFPRMTLRIGNQTVCVFNESTQGSVQ